MDTGAKEVPVHDDGKAEVAKDFFLSASDTTGEGDVVKSEEEADAESAPKPASEQEQEAKKDHEEQLRVEGSVGNDEVVAATYDEKKGVDWPEKAAALKSFVKERGVVVSKAIRRLSGRKEDLEQVVDDNAFEEAGKERQVSPQTGEKKLWSSFGFMKLNAPHDLASLEKKEDNLEGKGRVTLFSKSGCTDCKSARSLLRTKRVPFVEVNLDLFPHRSLELEERTGTSSVPQVFFNDQLVGGIDELNALQKSGELDERIKEVTENICPDTAPSPPVYGEDYPESAAPDEFAEVVRKLREKVQLKDRFLKLRLFNRCFVASDAVDFLAEDQYCERDEAVEFGRKLASKHFFHHVLHEHLFEDGNNFYRFLEHDPAVSTKCLNFSGATNDFEPKPAAEVGKMLMKLIHAIFERYISDDGKHVDYYAIAMSEEFRRYVNLTEDLHRIDLLTLTREETLSLFLNIYNAMAIHAIIRYGHPNGPLERRKFFGDIQYVIGGYAYSLSAIENGILRANQRPPYTITKVLGAKDPRLQVALKEPEPLIHFALSCGTQSSPAIRCYSPEEVDAELRAATRAFFDDGGIFIDSEARTISLSKMLKWYSVDFGKNEREVLHWIAKHINPTKAEHLLSLLEDTAQVKVNYIPYDWSLNV